MANEINGIPQLNTSSVNQSSQAKPSQSKPGNSDASNTKNPPTNLTDSVSLTDSAKKLQVLEKQIAVMPVVDNQRVTSIREAIEKGEYKIDPLKTATKMLNLELNLVK